MNNFNIKKSQLDTPCLIIEKQTLISNLELMRAHGIKNNVSIRPHVKTHKCTELAKLQIEYDAIGISAAKISEAEGLINKGIRNVLITSPIVTKEKIRRLISCIQQAPDTIIVVDNEHNLNDLSEAANAISFKINVLVDIDPGIGRTGVNPDLALDFALKTNNFNSLNLMGIQCYAGNLQHISSYKERKNSSLNISSNSSGFAQHSATVLTIPPNKSTVLMIGLNRAATAKPAEINMNIPAACRPSKVSSKLPVTKLPMVAKKWAPIDKAITAEAIANWGVSVTIDVALTAKLVVDLIGVKKNERIGAPL
ncbi:alanine racemase [Legionella fallonii]|uniref:Putative alanine racemase n=1 Tax=Legionella fallonii LLAP-10 TaxID=1212491 RepID=A0A098G358_9GAMM|nr:alanine racemase [Legionella fallonii]CEG56893.1 Putative alanine racemase [Legionella fallonii LLAP-10]